LPIIEDFTLKSVNYNPSTQKKGIVICIPVSDTIPGMFLSSFAKVFASLSSTGWAVALSITDVLPLDRAREMLCNDALSMDPELKYILWLDADMFVNQAHISKLITHIENHPDVDVVSALYFTKSRFEPTCYRKTPDKPEYKRFMPPTKEPTEIDAVGFGCMIVRTRALKEKLLPTLDEPKRLFFFEYMGKGEDINFCSMMQKAGMKMIVLPDVVVPHQGGFVDDNDYRNYAQKP